MATITLTSDDGSTVVIDTSASPSESTIRPQLNRMENLLMALTDSVAQLQTAVGGVSTRVNDLVTTSAAEIAAAQQTVLDLQAARDALAASEDAEDVAQNAEIARLQALLDQQLADAATAAAGITEAVTALDSIAAGDPVEPTDPPVDPAPADGVVVDTTTDNTPA